MNNKISVVINTYNEENNIRECIEAVKGFDEVVVCDMESTDHTRLIAEQMGCRVVIFPKKNYNIVEPARQFGIDAATHEWVLVLDADELVTPQLREFLYAQIRQKECADGWLIPRKNHTLNTFIKSSYPDYQLRFFRKSVTTWPPIIHVRPKVDGRVECVPKTDMKLALMHKSESMSKIVEKMNTYTTNEVERKTGKKATLSAFFFQPFFLFFKFYVLKAGFRYGRIGFIQAANKAVYRYHLLCKIYEREMEQKL